MILRVILVGVGGHGQWAVELFGKDPKFNPVAVVDTNTTTAKVAQYRLQEMGRKGVSVFSGLTGALSQVEADALVICTPTSTHAEYCHMGFSVSMHVLVESCMTTEWGKAKQLVEEAAAAWSKFCVVQRDRYSAIEQTMRYILKTPHHPAFPGEPKRASFVQHSTLKEGGVLDESITGACDLIGRHADSLAAWLGPVKKVTGQLSRAPWSAWIHDSEFRATIEYGTKAVCDYWLWFDAAIPRDEVVLEGERGALAMVSHAELYFYPRDGSDVQIVEVMESPLSEQAIADEFFEYIVKEVEPAISGKSNLQTLAVCEMIIRSAKAGRTVERSELG